MASKWHSTQYPGVRYREHPTRKHGIQKDRYFVINYQRDGKRKEEGLGWASEGWSAAKAFEKRQQLKRAGKRLSQEREEERRRREEEERLKRQAELEALTFGDFFETTYFPQAKQDKKPGSYKREQHLYNLWIAPVIGDKPLKDVSPIHLEQIKKAMAKAGRAPRTIHYALATIRQVFNHARRLQVFQGDNPVKSVKKPKYNNKRLRFLTHEEAEKLFAALKIRSLQTYEMALLSLHCGLRAGEIFSLTWGDVDLERGLLTLRNTKNGQSRVVYMTSSVKAMLRNHAQDTWNEFVFRNRTGGKVKYLSKTFDEVVKELGLNKGITDRRQKVTFHTLRHTFASWLVMEGVDLYTVQKLLGHSTITMTERYAHLAPDKFKMAAEVLEESIDRHSTKVVDLSIKRAKVEA